MKHEFELQEKHLVYYMPQEVDQFHAQKIREMIDPMIDQGSVRSICFDFSNTSFMDSSGIGVVIGRSRKLGYYGGCVRARNLSGRAAMIFAAAGLQELIEMEGKEDGK